MSNFNELEIRKTLQILKPNNQLFEIRLVGKKGAATGYFTDVDIMLKNLKRQDLLNTNVYITLNSINPDCYARNQRDKFVYGKQDGTKDKDIIAYNYMMIDLDPNRISGTSSSEEELMLTKKKANEVYTYMLNQGFEKPIVCESGNGVHLLYAIEIDPSKESNVLINDCLTVLSLLFSDKAVTIDAANFNQSRITKLYGTVAKKGSDAPNRPHRQSRILGDYQDVKKTDISYLKKLASYLPEKEEPKKYNNYRPSEFDLKDWLDKHGIRYKTDSSISATKYILDHCPFDSSHKGKDAVIFQRSDGAIGFHCFHNSCADKKWQDVRLMFEPDAYEKKYEEYEPRRQMKREQAKPIVAEENKPLFFKADNFLNKSTTEEIFIPTGIDEIDRKMRGLKKGAITLASGLRASGKSSVLSEIALNVVNKGYRVAFYSGELSPKNFYRWLELQAAGKGYTQSTQYDGYYVVPMNYRKKISDWLSDKLLLFNNDYGNKYESIIKEFEKQIIEKKLDLIILDNLMSFDIKSFSMDKYEAQKDFVNSIATTAKQYNVHVIYVCHPRKAMGFLRLDDVSGVGDLSNMADNAFIVHRVNSDFKRLSNQMFGWKKDCELYEATNVIEIAKNRENGVQDHFIPLYYEPETKRLKNDIAENKVYGWNENDIDGFIQLDMDSENPFT